MQHKWGDTHIICLAGTGRRFVVKRRDDVPVSSNRSSLVARREGQAKRKSRQLDALGRVRSSSLSGQRVNRSDVARSRNSDRSNQRRREFEADHAGKLLSASYAITEVSFLTRVQGLRLLLHSGQCVGFKNSSNSNFDGGDVKLGMQDELIKVIVFLKT